MMQLHLSHHREFSATNDSEWELSTKRKKEKKMAPVTSPTEHQKEHLRINVGKILDYRK